MILSATSTAAPAHGQGTVMRALPDRAARTVLRHTVPSGVAGRYLHVTDKIGHSAVQAEVADASGAGGHQELGRWR